jgi:hypothetical protein
VSISSIGIQTVTPTTGTSQQQPQQQQQDNAANDNSSHGTTKYHAPSQTVGQHVDKRV